MAIPSITLGTMLTVDIAKWWWIAGFFLLLMELYLPTISFWLAGAAFATGTIIFFIPNISLGGQIVLFSIISAVSIFAWQRFFSGQPNSNLSNHLNEGLGGYVGRKACVTEAIVHGSGQIKLDGVPWHVTGVDCPVDTLVQIIGVDNNMTFKVRRFEK